MTEIENRIEEARNRILRPVHPDFSGEHILAAIRDFNRACEDYRRWVRTHPIIVPAEERRTDFPEPVAHPFRWTEKGIEFTN